MAASPWSCTGYARSAAAAASHGSSAAAPHGGRAAPSRCPEPHSAQKAPLTFAPHVWQNLGAGVAATDGAPHSGQYFPAGGPAPHAHGAALAFG